LHLLIFLQNYKVDKHYDRDQPSESLTD